MKGLGLVNISGDIFSYFHTVHKCDRQRQTDRRNYDNIYCACIQCVVQ